jgi:hypothetical protein
MPSYIICILSPVGTIGAAREGPMASSALKNPKRRGTKPTCRSTTHRAYVCPPLSEAIEMTFAESESSENGTPPLLYIVCAPGCHCFVFRPCLFEQDQDYMHDRAEDAICCDARSTGKR